MSSVNFDFSNARRLVENNKIFEKINAIFMTLIFSIPPLVWLIISALFFASGEYLSKSWALNPTLLKVVLTILAYAVSSLMWLPAIYQKNQLAIMGTIWLLLGTVATVAIGILVFREQLTLAQGFGLFFAIIGMILLSG